jgi:hypothetical protein
VETSLKMVTAQKAHGRVNGYFRNTLRITQHKAPLLAGLFLQTLMRYTHLRAEDLVRKLG